MWDVSESNSNRRYMKQYWEDLIFRSLTVEIGGTFQGQRLEKKLTDLREKMTVVMRENVWRGSFSCQLADILNLISVLNPQVFKVSIINHFVMLFALGFFFYFVFCFISYFSFFKARGKLHRVEADKRHERVKPVENCDFKIMFLESWYYTRPAEPWGKQESLLLCFLRNQIQKKPKRKQCEVRKESCCKDPPSL